jgi:hypothetical protein
VREVSVKAKSASQMAVWLPPLGGECEFGQRSIAVAKKPSTVWTLYTQRGEADRPAIPFKPQHNVNAFLEDYVHDWEWANGKLRYYSRVVGAQDGVWLLLEY